MAGGPAGPLPHRLRRGSQRRRGCHGLQQCRGRGEPLLLRRGVPEQRPRRAGRRGRERLPQAGQNAKLIRRAELEIQTETFDAVAASLEALVAEAGGYFQSAQVEGGSLRDQNAARYGNYVIRLPEENFSAFLDQSGTLGYVVRRSESSENVSQAYYDTETRLAAQRTKQERLLALLAQADTMESILELENALSETEYEIQSLTTDLEHYDDLIDYATVDLYLAEVLSLSQTPGGDRRTGGTDGCRPVCQRGRTGPGDPGPLGVAVLPPASGGRSGGAAAGGGLYLRRRRQKNKKTEKNGRNIGGTGRKNRSGGSK